MKEAVTITVGTVVGVGLFTTGANVVGTMGPAVILATLVAMLISIYPALLYAEMGAALPYAGGTYKYASLGIGRPMGMLAGWNFIISLVAVTSGEALAFSFYFKTFFSALGIDLPVSDTVIATITVIVFIITNVRGVEMTGRLQNGFMFFFWGVAIIWFLTMIPNVQMPNFVQLPEFMKNTTPLGFVAAVSMIWWCFAGFETCCAMGEEIKYPQINIPKVFAKIHKKYQTPYVAILTLGILSAVLIASNSMIYIASVSLFADLFYYVIGIAASFGLRKKCPDLKRPYKAPGIMIGAPVSVVIYIIMMTQLEREALITGVIWCVLGLVVYAICRKKYGEPDEEEEVFILKEEIPSPEEKAKMDKEFKIWSVIVGGAVVLALVMYLIPFFF